MRQAGEGDEELTLHLAGPERIQPAHGPLDSEPGILV